MQVRLLLPFLFLFAHALSAQVPDTVYAVAGINSPYDEQAPVIDPSGTRLYYTIAKHPQNAGGTTDPGDIWVATLDSLGQWQRTYRDSILCSTDYNAVAGFSPRGDTIFLHGHYTGREGLYLRGISYAIATDSGWSRPQKLTVKYHKNDAPHQSGGISADGSVIILSLEAFSSRGAEDLYVAFRQPDGSYTGLKNMGDIINTRGQEMAPYLAPDGRTLYFTSNLHPGARGRDRFVAYRLDDSYTQWTQPQHLPAPLSTSGVDIYLTFDPEQRWAYFTKSESSELYGDIYRYRLPQPPKEEDPLDIFFETITGIADARTMLGIPKPLADTTLADSTTSRADSALVHRDTLPADTLPVATLDSAAVDSLPLVGIDSMATDTLAADSLQVAQADSLLTDSTSIALADSLGRGDTLSVPGLQRVSIRLVTDSGQVLAGKAVLHAADTVWRATLIDSLLWAEVPDSLTEVELHASAVGYFTRQIALYLPLPDSVPTIIMQPLAVGATINLESVLFEQGTDEMLEGSFGELDDLVTLMEENPGLRIELGGHTDNRGNPEANLRLSQARVSKVKDYLVAHGIHPDRIVGMGYGGDRPLVFRGSSEERKVNRRVEMKIIGNED